MGKNSDLAQILLIVIIGMFIPFIGSLIIVFDVSPLNMNGFLTISSTFGYFLLIFALELFIVYLYFYLTNSVAQKKIEKEANKRKEK